MVGREGALGNIVNEGIASREASVVIANHLITKVAVGDREQRAVAGRTGKEKR